MNLDKKVIFFARDPGGASPLVSIIPNFKKALVYAQDYALDIFKSHNIPCKSINKPKELELKLQNCDLLVTGTSYLNNSDKELWLEAKKSNIISVAYFDHWMNFKRFFHTEKKIEIFPDYIIVIDKIAKEGILSNNPNCTSKIMTLGSSFLQNVLMQKNSLDLKNEFENNYLYAAEKIKGYDIENTYKVNEFTQFEILVDTLENSNKKTRLFFRSHPKHSKVKIEKYLKSFNTINCSIVLDNSIDKYPLVNSVDALFGINSMVLVEGLVLGKKVCSINNNMRQTSSFELLKKNIIFSSKTQKDLDDFLTGKIQTLQYDTSYIENSQNRVIHFLESL